MHGQLVSVCLLVSLVNQEHQNLVLLDLNGASCKDTRPVFAESLLFLWAADASKLYGAQKIHLRFYLITQDFLIIPSVAVSTGLALPLAWKKYNLVIEDGLSEVYLW